MLDTAGGVRLAYYIIMVVKGHALGHSGVICLRWNRGRSPANGSERRETILSGECLCQLQNVGCKDKVKNAHYGEPKGGVALDGKGAEEL